MGLVVGIKYLWSFAASHLPSEYLLFLFEMDLSWEKEDTVHS